MKLIVFYSPFSRHVLSTYLRGLTPLSPKRQASSKRWQARQLKDHFTREAAAQGLKSRAAFKLLQVLLSLPQMLGKLT